MTRKRRTISYYGSADENDLEELLRILRQTKDSPYWNRSLSDIGGMILLNGAEAEVKKYRREGSPSSDQGDRS